MPDPVQAAPPKSSNVVLVVTPAGEVWVPARLDNRGRLVPIEQEGWRFVEVATYPRWHAKPE